MLEDNANAWISTTDDGTTYLVGLQYPVQVAKQEISEVIVRKPRMKDLKAMDEATGDVGKAIALASSVTRVTSRAFDDMDPDDFGRISEVIAMLMGKPESPETGGT